MPEMLPDDIAVLQAALIAERERAARIEAELAIAKAKVSEDPIHPTFILERVKCLLNASKTTYAVSD